MSRHAEPCLCATNGEDGCPRHYIDPIWLATVSGELDPPEEDLGYHPEDH